MNTRRYTTQDMFNDPFFIGFDNLMNKMHSLNGSNATNYPPYNLIKTSENTYRVELAVAGFTEDELEVLVENGTLTIKGSSQEDKDTSSYIHRGISAREFKRTFTLADTVVVTSADLVNGILLVNLENVIPEEKKPRVVPIGKPADRQLLTESTG